MSHRLKFHRPWRLVGFVGIGLLIYLSFMRNPPSIEVEHIGDKIGHFLAYFVLASWLLWISQRRFWSIAIFLLVLGMLIELVQPLTGFREFDIFDWLANTIAVFCVSVLSATPYRNTLVVVESLLVRIGRRSPKCSDTVD